MLFRKCYSEKEIKCRYCKQNVKPLIQLNRTKSEFIGRRYTGSDKNFWLVCPNCKKVIGSK